MAPPPWGSEHGLYVVVVDAGGALMGREPQLQLPVHMRLKVHDCKQRHASGRATSILHVSKN